MSLRLFGNACVETLRPRGGLVLLKVFVSSVTILVVEILGPLLVHAVAEVDHDVVEHGRLDVLGHLKRGTLLISKAATV